MNHVVDGSLPETPALPSTRRVGRPRRLTLDAIVDAACAFGFDQIEMALVAQRLNTGVATLYSYVRNREHLLQLVAERLVQKYRVEDRGQDWRQLLRDHGEMAEATFRTMPHLIGDLLAAQHLNRADEYAQRFISMLTARGFAINDAIDIYVETTQIIIGAAICAQRRRILVGARAEGTISPLPAIIGDHRPTLERLIRDVDATLRARDATAPKPQSVHEAEGR